MLVYCVALPLILWYVSRPWGLYFLVYIYDPIFGPPNGAIGLIIWGGTPFLVTGVTFILGLRHTFVQFRNGADA